jgi:hypothetical protein
MAQKGNTELRSGKNMPSKHVAPPGLFILKYILIIGYAFRRSLTNRLLDARSSQLKLNYRLPLHTIVVFRFFTGNDRGGHFYEAY